MISYTFSYKVVLLRTTFAGLPIQSEWNDGFRWIFFCDSLAFVYIYVCIVVSMFTCVIIILKDKNKEN